MITLPQSCSVSSKHHWDDKETSEKEYESI